MLTDLADILQFGEINSDHPPAYFTQLKKNDNILAIIVKMFNIRQMKSLKTYLAEIGCFITVKLFQKVQNG